MTITARTQALRFRIWQYANPREWNVTTHEIADAIGETHNRVRAIIGHAGWHNRLRSMTDGDYEKTATGFHAIGTAAAARYIAADFVAGRIFNEASI